MRLEDCVLKIDAVVGAPLKPKVPEPGWIDALDSCQIPRSLYGLYTKAKFFAFDSAPSFLSDPDKILFSYFSMLVRGLKDALVEAHELAQDFEEAEARTWDPGKRVRGETWERAAEERSRRLFKYLMVVASGALDSIAELIALFFTGRVPALQVGRSQFTRVEDWLRAPLAGSTLIVSPHDHHIEILHSRLADSVFPTGPERDWLPLLRLYRNKSAHLGAHMFRKTGLHDESGVFYTFLPSRWPYIWEKHLAPPDSRKPPDQEVTRALLEETLVHQDIISFAHGLVNKLVSVVGLACELLGNAYEDLREGSPNTAALAELQGNSRQLAFSHFEERGSEGRPMSGGE